MNLIKMKPVIILCLLMISEVLHGQSWNRINTTNNPPPRSNASCIYDAAANRIIIFGGRNLKGNLNDVWALNLSSNVWQQIIPSGSAPPPRFTQNAFFDSSSYRMIIWSGQGAELYNDVWALNLGSNTWQQLWPDGNVSGAPLKRYGTAAVFDPVSRRFTTFAGFTTSGRFEDTWYFQVDSLRWTDATNNFHPPLRCLHTACRITEQNKMIVYGGQNMGALDDIWSLDLAAFNWTNITPAVRPPARFFTSVIFAGGKAVIYGGHNGQTVLGDLWKFSISSGTWDSIPQGNVKPSARSSHTGVYIPQQDKMLLFGGADSIYLNDTWEFTNIGAIGIGETQSGVPKEFILYQNYPNPFNASTKIKFSIPPSKGVRGMTKLIVYDILGREIASFFSSPWERLVRQGSYGGGAAFEVEFDGSAFPSGVYFYRLIAGGFVQTKKMILIK